MFNVSIMNVNVFKALGLMAIVAISTGLASCGGQQQQQQAAAPEIATITVAYGTADLNSDYAATIKGRTDIDIRPQVTGFITKVHVDEGQKVRRGQVLFTLDQVQYQAAVDAAAASVKVAESAVSTAQLTARTSSSQPHQRSQEPCLHRGDRSQRRRSRLYPQPRRRSRITLDGTAPHHRQRQLQSLCILLAQRERHPFAHQWRNRIARKENRRYARSATPTR